MKIYLYLPNRIILFKIPSKVSGSFSFDENIDEESKLINIEAHDSKWYINGTSDVSLIVNNKLEASTKIVPNSFYVLRRKNVNYLIYVTDSFDSTTLPYLYKQNINLVIGNDEKCNVKLALNMIEGIAAKIYMKDTILILERNNTLIYINNKAVTSPKYAIKVGDQLNIFGFKIMFFGGFLILNNPNNIVRLNLNDTNLSPFNFNYGDTPTNIEIHDVDLYHKEDYFSKSPRIRRTIETKVINLSPPPRQDSERNMPMILTAGPMLTMGAASVIMLVNNYSKMKTGQISLQESWSQLATSGTMLLSILVWPAITSVFNKFYQKAKKKELIKKYSKYLETKKQELEEAANLQRDILKENYITVEECISIIEKAKLNFWDKRIEQNDFLEVRLGTGNILLDATINYPQEGFTIEEDELRKQADAMVEKYKYLNDVPVGYSLYKNKLTAIMGDEKKFYGMVNNILLQLITFYSYDDIKIVVFTEDSKKKNWSYIKYLKHSFSNDMFIRFFSTNIESAKKLNDYFYYEIQNRIAQAQEGITSFKPYYLVISDDYSSIKRLPFIKSLTETDVNVGFSLLLLESQLSRLPSKCNNFIVLGDTSSGILTNSFEKQERITFQDNINNNIDMMRVVRKLSNIPIEFEEGIKPLPDAITFLEMEKVGKVEQLNIMNRWDSNDATESLRAEIGVDEEGNAMYLDLHEKAHGPHGLIAGMTGSGKSEFIITYILSMAINYSPDDVNFILIDYKGGGLAGAFENKNTGISLPHLAGIITNLDKAEMDRTLISIDSEVKRREQIFNSVRDAIGESTIDIYKYQRLYKEGKISEAIPHLFIICDEFAELKAQQPDFMDNLISVARIGRSLGVHLILATQKPSGVVNDQIWSNTKFRVCLKVQNASDSNELLKRPDAASLKQTGRFYLQVGFDEYFALGQSAWCGAKYYPSERIIKQTDKSINFIGDTGNFVKSIEVGNQVRTEAKGEQLSAILNKIIEVSNELNKKAKRLWLNNIDPTITIAALEKKYNVNFEPYKIESIVGEYDAPEKQEQGLLVYSLNKNGNTIIYGSDEAEREKLVNTMIYSICIHHLVEEINIYAIDYGSESLRVFNDFSQVGGIVFSGEDENFKNLFKYMDNEIKNRKKLFIPYGGNIVNYNNKEEAKLPYILLVINNFEAILESYNDFYDTLTSIARDCERYGIVILLTCNSPSTLSRKVSQCFENKYALHLNDSTDYYSIFNSKCETDPRDIFGRGLVNNEGIHEFQTASIMEDENKIHAHLLEVAAKLKEISKKKAPQIPTLPDTVSFDRIKNEITTISNVPIGIYKESLKIAKYDFKSTPIMNISSNKLAYINSFIDSLTDILLRISNQLIVFLDVSSSIPSIATKQFNNKKIYYYNSNFDNVLNKFVDISMDDTYKNSSFTYIIYGIEKLKGKVDENLLERCFSKLIDNDRNNIILCDSNKGFKAIDFDPWYAKIKNNTDGIWIGKNLDEQQVFRISKLTKEMTASYPNNFGFIIEENEAELVKLIEFHSVTVDGDENNE